MTRARRSRPGLAGPIPLPAIGGCIYCGGPAAHLVCRPDPIATVKNTLAEFVAALSNPPARPRVWSCGCDGARHVVCDPTWRRVCDARAESKPVRPMRLRDAIRAGMTVRPHRDHAFTCPPGCPWPDGALFTPVGRSPWRRDSFTPWRSERPHWHACGCNVPEVTLDFCAHMRGQTIRRPIATEAP